MLNFRGIYFCDKGEPGEGYSCGGASVEALRFFEDGKVVYVGLNLSKADIKNMSKLADYIQTWFNSEYVNYGKYSIQENKIIFSINFEHGMVIEYEGIILDNKLLLKWQENINANFKIMEDEYIFSPFKNKKQKTRT